MSLELAVRRALIYLVSYILALVPVHFIVRGILKRYPLTPIGEPQGSLEPDQARGLERGGAIIGVLERALTLTFVLLGQYTAVALIINAKSIARFPELRHRKFAEYYLVGTLSSMLFATLIGVVASWFLTLL